jgi:hypothetical protein
MLSHAPVGQVTSHAHEDPQLTAPHAPAAWHLTLHRPPAPQNTSSQALVALQVMAHPTFEPHRRSPQALAVEQVMSHDRAPAGQIWPLHAFVPEQVIVHA